jgi:thiol-disulfide isomerase/thioredoxin
MSVAWWQPGTARALAVLAWSRVALAGALAAVVVGAAVLAVSLWPRQARPTLAALVNGSPVTMASYDRQLAYATAGYSGPGAPGTSTTGLVVARLIANKAMQEAIGQVLIDKAAGKYRITVTPREVAGEAARLEAAEGGTEAARREMRTAGMTAGDVATVARYTVLRDRLSSALRDRAWLEEAFANSTIQYFVPDLAVGSGLGQQITLGSAAPAFVATDLRGRPVTLADLRGRVVVLNFWATWSGYSERELLLLRAYARRYPDLYVVALNHGGDTRSVRAYVRDHRLQGLTVWLDSGGTGYAAYQMTGIPATFFIDMHGVLRSYNYGALADLSTLDDQTSHARRGLNNTVFNQWR